MNSTYLVSIILMLGCGGHPNNTVDDSTRSNSKSGVGIDPKFKITKKEDKTYLVADGVDSITFDVIGDADLYYSKGNNEVLLNGNSFASTGAGEYRVYGKKGNKKTNSFKIISVTKVDLTDDNRQVRRRSDKTKVRISDDKVPFQVFYQGTQLEKWEDIFEIDDSNPTVQLQLNGRSLGEIEFYLHNFNVGFVDTDGNKQNFSQHQMLFDQNLQYKISLLNDNDVSDVDVKFKYNNQTTKIEGKADINDITALGKGRIQIVGHIVQEHNGSSIDIQTNTLQLNIYPNLGEHSCGTLEAGQMSQKFEMDIAPFKLTEYSKDSTAYENIQSSQKSDLVYSHEIVIIPIDGKFQVTPLFLQSGEKDISVKIDDFKVGSIKVTFNNNFQADIEPDKWPGISNPGASCYFNTASKMLCSLISPKAKDKDFTKATRGFFHAIRSGQKSGFVGQTGVISERFIIRFMEMFNNEIKARALPNSKSTVFVTNVQHDASEVINHWVDLLGDEATEYFQYRSILHRFNDVRRIGGRGDDGESNELFKRLVLGNDKTEISISNLIDLNKKNEIGEVSNESIDFNTMVVESYREVKEFNDADDQMSLYESNPFSRVYKDDKIGQEIVEYLITHNSAGEVEPRENGSEYVLRNSKANSVIYNDLQQELGRLSHKGYGYNKGPFEKESENTKDKIVKTIQLRDDMEVEVKITRYHKLEGLKEVSFMKLPDNGAPKYLMFTLGRQENNRHFNGRPVVLEEDLNVDFFNSNIQSGDIHMNDDQNAYQTSQPYKLLGYINRSGGSNINGGHYTMDVAYASRWYRHNDSHVGEVSPKLVSTNAATAIYVKVE